MKKRLSAKLLLVGGLLLGGTMFSGMTATAGDLTMNITAQVTSSITETVTTDLDFGIIDLDPAGDTIQLNGSAGASTTPVITGASAVGGTPTTGLITVASPLAFNIDITYPIDGSVTLADVTDGSSTLSLDAITANSTASGVAHAAGVDSLINVGGILSIPAGADTDSYTGTMTITLVYN
jgi:hypothetical protein